MTRRVLLGTGAVVVTAGGALAVAGATHRLDDVADAVGLDPKPLPDPEDSRILRRAARRTAILLATTEATATAFPDLTLADLEVAAREQLAALGGGTAAATDVAAPPADRAAAVAALVDAYAVAATQRADDAGDAFSPALVRVLASMSAGHAQAARLLRGLR